MSGCAARPPTGPERYCIQARLLGHADESREPPVRVPCAAIYADRRRDRAPRMQLDLEVAYDLADPRRIPHGRALAAPTTGLAEPLSDRPVPEPAAAPGLRRLGTRSRDQWYGTRRRPGGLHHRPRRVGVGGDGERRQLAPSSARS